MNFQYKYIFKFIVNYFFSYFKFKKSYSLNGEDLIIKDYFVSKKKFKGKYLDIGAFHPKWLSLTCCLHNIGWSGYVVEPDRDKCLSFSILRKKKCQIINKAVSINDESLKFFKFKRKMIYSEINTCDANFRERFKDREAYIKNVEAISMEKLIKSIELVDFIKISSEGTEEKLLEILLKSEKLPEMICFRKNPGNSYEVLEKSFFNKNYKILFNSTAFMCYVRFYEKK